jgi:hypothetical protein
MKSIFYKLFILFTIPMLSQAIKPKVIIVPADSWMTQHGYVTVEKEDGSTQTTLEYAKAFQSDPILNAVINKVGGIFAERGFNLTDMAQEIKAIKAKSERNKIAGRVISALDELALAVNPDIYLYLDYNLTGQDMFGQNQVDRFSITAIDAYSRQNVGSVGPEAGPKSSGSAADLVSERVLARINELESDILGVFDKYTKNGRDVVVEFQVSPDAVSGGCWDLYAAEIKGQMLVDYITAWANERSIKAANVSPSSSGEAITIEMSIPLKTADGKPTKAMTYALQALRDTGLNTLFKMRPDEQGLGYCIVNVTECK